LEIKLSAIKLPSAIKKKLWRKTKQQPINKTIRSRRWKWIGNTLRKENNNITKQALEWNPKEKEREVDKKNSWHRGIISELQAINTTWREAKRKAQNRTRWKETVVALCPPWDEVE
jgi:hypothetical protein